MDQVRTPPPEDSYNYPGLELDLFARAHHWRTYWASQIDRYLNGNVLEVGAGIGSPVQLLQDTRFARWVCLEPDYVQLKEIDKKIASGEILSNVEIKHGDIRALDPNERFDSILYLDVLEHIEEDAQELTSAYELLSPGGYLIILSPAHQMLYTPFDAAIGHHRRYNKKMLRAILPVGSKICEEKYLDSFGLIATLANKLFLRASSPSPLQILLWDSYLIPISKMMDRLFFWRLGKTILYIIQRPV